MSRAMRWRTAASNLIGPSGKAVHALATDTTDATDTSSGLAFSLPFAPTQEKTW